MEESRITIHDTKTLLESVDQGETARKQQFDLNCPLLYFRESSETELVAIEKKTPNLQATVWAHLRPQRNTCNLMCHLCIVAFVENNMPL